MPRYSVKTLLITAVLIILAAFSISGCTSAYRIGTDVPPEIETQKQDTGYVSQPGDKAISHQVVFYLLSADQRFLVPVFEEIELTEGESLAEAAVRKLASSELPDGLVSLWPGDLAVDLYLQGRTAYVDIGQDGLERIAGGGLQEEAVSQLVYTLTEFDDITWVYLLARGKPITEKVGRFDLSQALERPRYINYLGGGPNPTTVYLVLQDSPLLVPVTVSFHGESVESLLALLAEAAYEGLRPPLPDSGVIRQAYVKGDTAYVDFHGVIVQELLENTFNERLALLSVVATLTELEDINQVQIMIQGKIIGSTGIIDISRPLSKPRFLNPTVENNN